MGRHGRAHQGSGPVPAGQRAAAPRSGGVRARPAGSVTSTGGLHGVDPRLRGTDRPLAAPGVVPRGGRPGHSAAPGRRRLHRGPGRAARRGRLQPALGVPPRRVHPHRDQVPEAAARSGRDRRRRGLRRVGGARPASGPVCSSAAPTPPRRTSSSPWPNGRPTPSRARWGSTTTSSCTPPTCWPGSRHTIWPRPTCVDRRSGRHPASTCRT